VRESVLGTLPPASAGVPALAGQVYVLRYNGYKLMNCSVTDMSKLRKNPKCANKYYQFILVLGNVKEATPNLEDSLFEAGCDDALINFRNGMVNLDFDREAHSREEAVLSAIKSVESSSVRAVVVSVGQAES